MTDKQAPQQNDSEQNQPKDRQKVQEKPGFIKRNLWNFSLIAIAGYAYMHFNNASENGPVAYDLMSGTEFIQTINQGDIKAAQIEKIDGQYVVTGTLNTNTYEKPAPDAANEPLSEKELKSGPKYKTVMGAADPTSMLESQNIPVSTVEHDPYKRPAPEIISIDDLEMLIDQNRVSGISYTNVSTGNGTIFDGVYKPVSGDNDYEVAFQTTEHGAATEGVIQKIKDNGIKRNYVAPQGAGWLSSVLPWLIFPAVFIGFMLWQARGAGNGRPAHQRIDPEDIQEGFDDVQGVDSQKRQLQQMVRYLKNPEEIAKMGAKPPKGALLSGQPGTGKTMLAKAIAKEADVPFFSINGSDFVEMFVGVGARRARALFEDAKKNAPCIIFIDEIDAVGGNRGGNMSNGHSEQQQTLTQILTAMDGFEAQSGVIVIAATNRPESLDPALVRAGRLDRKIEVTLPDLIGRAQILTKYMSKRNCAKDIDIETVARTTPGFPGAELVNLVNEALLLAQEDGRNEADMMDFITARDNIVFGATKQLTITEKEQRLTCDHEAGHAIVMKYTEGSDQILKATATPRAKTLGMVETFFDGDRVSYNKKQLLAYMDAAMGGRIAEEIWHGEDYVTTGASQDIKQATTIARQMILDWGFSDFGMQSFTEEQRATFLSQGSSSLTDMSNEQKAKLDEQINVLLKESYERARNLITLRKDELELVSNALFKYETISGEEIDTICAGGEINRRPTQAINDNKKSAPPSSNQGGVQGPEMRMG